MTIVGVSSMEETPKKVLQSDRCFICSTAVPKKDKIYIFGKSSFDFAAIISSCLDVNVGCYSATSELSVCKTCYRRLIKFKKASDHLEELKKELKGIFKDRQLPRTKRLLNVGSDNGETPASCRYINVTYKSLVVKCHVFNSRQYSWGHYIIIAE